MTDQPTATPAADAAPAPAPAPALPRGRTEPLTEREADRLFWQGVALFNGARYWHAHEAWETLWRAAPEAERDFYQGLIQVAAGLIHLERRNARGAVNKLSEGLDRLRPYAPKHRGIVVGELLGTGGGILKDLRGGEIPYLIPPTIKEAELDEQRYRDR